MEGWSNKKVKDICDLGRGRVIGAQEIELNPGIYSVFSSQSQNRGEMGKIDTYDFDGEYVTWTTDGAYAGTVFYRVGKFNCTNVCGTLKAKNSQVSMKFIAYNLSTLAKNHVSYVGNPKLMNNVMANIELSLPDIKEEQAQIATILSTIDRAIEQTEDIIAKQQRIKTGLIQDLLTKGIDEDGNVRSEETHEFKDSPLGRIPVDWDVQLLDKLAERGSGHTPNKTHQEYWNGGIKWVSLADSSKLDNIYIFDTDKEISEQGLKNSSAVLHPKGTVIVSRDAGVGKSAILSTQMAVSQHFIVWRCSRNLNNYYLYYWLQKDKPKFEGIALGSTIVTIGLQFFREYLIAIPNLLDEQIFIAQIIKHSDECLCEHQHNLEKLKRQKTGLMQDLLTGNVRVIALLNDQNKTPIHETVTLK